MGLRIRPARPGDGDGLARVHERGWTISHSAYADASWVVERPFAERSALWEGFARGEGVPMWVAEEAAEIVGSVSAGPSRDAGAPPGTGEVYALYVDPDRHREGIGRALLARAVEGLRAQGFARATLWTFGASEQSTAFYEAEGWARDGTEKDDRGLGATEVRYVRAL